jgi:hypothetical protein
LLHEALKRARGDVTFYKIAGTGHGSPECNTEMMQAVVQAFFDDYLKPRSDGNARAPAQSKEVATGVRSHALNRALAKPNDLPVSEVYR